MFLRIVVVLLLIVSSLAAQTAPKAEPKPPANSTATRPASSTKLSPEKEADIRKLLELAQVASIMRATMDSMEANLRPMLVNSFPPGEYRNKLIDLFFERFRAKADPQQMINLAIAAYDQHFSDEEIKGLIKFYETPLGRKAVTETPQIMAELSQRGREWGERLGRESMQEVFAEHPELADAMKSAASATKLP